MDSSSVLEIEEMTSEESIVYIEDDKLPSSEECTSLLNTKEFKENETAFVCIELKVFTEESHTENLPVSLACDASEKPENDMECRICRCKDDEPLISPCKCSGSSKWIHQSCLVQWFQISKTSRCELCSQKVIIKKYTKPIREWKRPKGSFGPCNKVDLWYLFVTLFSIGTITGFGIFQGTIGSEESTETIVVFIAIYILCAIMILVRVRYFYIWFTQRSTFWNKWRSLNQNWNIKSSDPVQAV